MSDPPTAKPIDAHPSVISEDMACVICGYNLRGLTPEGRCPECGSPVDRSVHGSFLGYADPDWLAKLLVGIRLMLWSIVIGLVVGLIVGIGAALGAPRVLIGGLMIIMAGLDVLAAWFVTTQEPRIALSEDTVTLRKAIRICAGIAFLAQFLQHLGRTFGAVHLLAVIGSVLALTNVVAYVGRLIYLRRFALRIPDSKLARSTKAVMWGLGVIMAASAVVGILALIVVRPAIRAAATGVTTAPAVGKVVGVSVPAPPGTSIGPGAAAGIALMSAVGCVVGLGSMVFSIWYLVLLFQYRNAFRKALVAARAFAVAAGAFGGTRPT